MPIRTALVRLSLALTILASICSVPAFAEAPRPATATVEFTPAFASSLREVRRFEDIEAAAGAPGVEIGRGEESDGPHVVYGWTGAGGKGSMRAFLFRSGDFSIVVRPEGAAEDIVLNSFGAFVCPTCSPPVNACGRRPWWVPHDVHWDNFDCGCTLAGPQSVRVGRC